MLPLSELSPGPFASHDELIANLRGRAKLDGYGVSIARSKPNVVYLACDKGGLNRNNWKLTEETRKRFTTSRRTNCPFSVVGRERDGEWFLEVRNNLHNHPFSSDLSAHPSHRKLDQDQIAEVEAMSLAGIPTRNILTALRKKKTSNSKVLSTARDIYNITSRNKTKSLNGRTPIQTLLYELQEAQSPCDFELDMNGHITHLFFTHEKSISLIKQYHFTVLMDCTYKTNRFKLPLLNVVGITPFYTTFFICAVFIKAEKQDDYEWALSRIAALFDENNPPKVSEFYFTLIFFFFFGFTQFFLFINSSFVNFT